MRRLGHIYTCEKCGKRAWTKRKTARRVIRSMGGDGMREYRCPDDENVWHVGHTPRAVLRGKISAAELREKRRGLA